MNAFEKGMSKLLVAQLSELYFCEEHFIDALESMAGVTKSKDFQALLRSHRKETEQHKERLEHMFARMNEVPRAIPCHATEGLLRDGQKILLTMQNDMMLDHALMAGLHKAEMLEVASYRSAIQLARQLGNTEVAQLCESTLTEELEMDRKLREMSMNMLGQPA